MQLCRTWVWNTVTSNSRIETSIVSELPSRSHMSMYESGLKCLGTAQQSVASRNCCSCRLVCNEETNLHSRHTSFTLDTTKKKTKKKTLTSGFCLKGERVQSASNSWSNDSAVVVGVYRLQSWKHNTRAATLLFHRFFPARRSHVHWSEGHGRLNTLHSSAFKHL